MNAFTITIEIDMTKSYNENKQAVIRAFMRAYAPVLLRAHDGVIRQAAVTAKTDRKHLAMMMRKYGVDV